MDKAWATQLKKGVMELTVLAVLRDGEAYGYQLLQRLSGNSLLSTTESTLYPILARLADEELVAVRHAPSPAGPPRRYYRITARGQQHLRELIDYWHEFRQAIDGQLAGVQNGDTK